MWSDGLFLEEKSREPPDELVGAASSLPPPLSATRYQVSFSSSFFPSQSQSYSLTLLLRIRSHNLTEHFLYRFLLVNILKFDLKRPFRKKWKLLIGLWIFWYKISQYKFPICFDIFSSDLKYDEVLKSTAMSNTSFDCSFFNIS